MKQEYLTSNQAAKYLSYSEQSMKLSRMEGNKLANIKPPKHHKVGRVVMYATAELDRWINEVTAGNPMLWESIRNGSK